MHGLVGVLLLDYDAVEGAGAVSTHAGCTSKRRAARLMKRLSEDDSDRRRRRRHPQLPAAARRYHRATYDAASVAAAVR